MEIKSQDSRPKKQIPYWLALIVGALITCIVMTALVIPYQAGAFYPWKSLESLPAGIARIVDADFHEVWVEARDGQLYNACLMGPASADCPHWRPVEAVSETSKPPFSISTGSDCSSLHGGIFPLDPNGRIIECVYAYLPGPEMGEDTYFALMADGSLKYWTKGVSRTALQTLFILSTIVLPFFIGTLISLVYLIEYMRKRIRQNRG